MVFQHSRPLHRQTVLENITLALLPDKLRRFFPDPESEARARAIAERVGLAHVLDRRPSTLPFADLRTWRSPRPSRGTRRWCSSTSLSPASPRGRPAAFAQLVTELRDDGRAVLLVDHNVKSVAALVDRVFAMYVGERIAEGTADEVMRDETVRRVYLGGSIETAARPRILFRDKTPFLEVENLERLLRQGAGARGCVDPCASRRVRVGRRPQRGGQDHPLQRHLRHARLFAARFAAKAKRSAG